MINKTLNNDRKDIKNLSLAWLVIAVSVGIGWLIGTSSFPIVGYIVSATIAVFITLLIWHKGY